MRIKQHLPETTFQNKIEAEFSEKENTASNANNKFKNYELEAKTKEMYAFALINDGGCRITSSRKSNSSFDCLKKFNS